MIIVPEPILEAKNLIVEIPYDYSKSLVWGGDIPPQIRCEIAILHFFSAERIEVCKLSQVSQENCWYIRISHNTIVLIPLNLTVNEPPS